MRYENQRSDGLIFLSTLSLRRATNREKRKYPVRYISIHALLAESDAPNHNPCSRSRNFYPRSPCGERLSALAPEENPTQHFYPRSPCGERPPSIFMRKPGKVISIHALLAESDVPSVPHWLTPHQFLSTLSLRRATTQNFTALHDIFISIHALLAESDHPKLYGTARHIYFYPRSPCGERLKNLAIQAA